ncbi:hypothetical protein ACS0TY_015328 [Phlomoides rotata]
MSNFIKIVFAIVVCVCMAMLTTQAATNCQTVATSMAPCRTYLKSGGAVPNGCCDGVRSLKNAASTTTLKRAFCECLKTQAKSSGVNSNFAASLPAKCKVQIGYNINYNTDCTKIQ